MLKKLSLVLLCLCSLCFAMSRGPQQWGGRYVADRLSAAWNRSREAWNERLNQLFTKNIDVMSKEQDKIARASANLKQQQAKLGEIKSNAQKEFNRRSWFEFLTGKSSYADNERRQNARETLRKTRNQWIISRNKESILDKRNQILQQEAKDMAQYYQSRVR